MNVSLQSLLPFLPIGTEILTAGLGLFILVLSLLLRDRARFISGVLTFGGVLVILAYAIWQFGNSQIYFDGVYQSDVFGSFFKILFLTALLIVLLSSMKYVAQKTERRGEFYSLTMLATAGMMLMASAGDFITLYVGLELMTVSFYILTAFLVGDLRSNEAGLKYLILGAISSAIMLFGMSFIFAFSGTTVFTDIAAAVIGNPQPALIAGVILLLCGFGFKISAVPFHMWAPDIYEGAPMPITSYLAVGSKAAAFAALLRTMYIAIPVETINWPLFLAVLAAITMIAGNLMALPQKNIKRMLAYSSIAQAGYIMAGLVAVNEFGFKGVAFYAMVYVISNLGAFAVATAVEVDSGSSDIEAHAGLSRRSPFMAAVMTVCLLSLAGIPPMAGFVGKFYLFSGAIQGGYLWLAMIGLIMSMISVYYYLSVAKVMYIGRSDREKLSVNGGPAATLALWICLLGTVFIGIYPQPLSTLVERAVSLFF